MTTDHHDGGFILDLRAQLQRRRALGLLGSAGAGLLLSGCDFFGPPGNAEPNKTATAADGSSCIKLPPETQGPFPADGSNSRSGSTVNVLTDSGLLRQDIRPSFGGLQPVAEGPVLHVAIKLVDVANACAPLAGHLIYVWHCDVHGRYSIYEDEDRNYLRGAGITDAAGEVLFTSVFPGCYAGRWPHIHFEVFASAEKATSGAESLLVSQFALPGDVSKSIYQGSAIYAASVVNVQKLSIESDGIFRDNTPEQNAAMTMRVSGDAAAGLNASCTVGIVAG